MHRNIFLFVVVLFTALLLSCSPLSRHALQKTLYETESQFQDHTGFVIYDPLKQKNIYEFNSAKYFTPASNTKIFTLFASLRILGDSVPGLRYENRNDSLIFWGTGDPSFLYKKVFNNGRTIRFLQSADTPLYFSDMNFNTKHFGAGWAWDDYNDEYSVERSPFPIYGNVVSVSARQDKMVIQPPRFSQFLTRGPDREKPEVLRQLASNEFMYYPAFGKEFEADVPMVVDTKMICELLADTLEKKVQQVSIPLSPNARTLNSIPVDSLYKVMMQESDNFIAEQLLLLCAGTISDTLKPEIAIKFLKQGDLKDLVDEPIWVDGSGLSRYNLFTPRSIVQLWEKIYHLMPRDRLFALLATGGKAGTIKNWYAGQPPYLFGKTGSLSNNHCLSGFLVTRTGKTLIFSFMNSNFTASSNEIRRNMQSILYTFYENY